MAAELSTTRRLTPWSIGVVTFLGGPRVDSGALPLLWSYGRLVDTHARAAAQDLTTTEGAR